MSNVLPSQHQVGDKVILDFLAAGKLLFCQVFKVHFSRDKVTYDIDMDTCDMPNRGPLINTRIYNVDSQFVLPKDK